MNPMAIVVLLFMCAGLAWIFYEGWYNSTAHSTTDDHSKLRADAKIINVNTERVGRKQTSAIRTTVSFDDGFKYISHAAERKQHLTSYTLTVTKDVVNQIIMDAIKAHRAAIAKNVNQI